MRKLLRTAALGFAASLALAPAAVAQAALDDAAYLELGRKYYDWFAGGQADSLLAHMAEDTRAQSGGADGVRQRMDEFMFRAGAETELLVEKMNRRNGHPQYWRESRYSAFTDEPLVFRWLFNPEGQVVGIGMGPKSRTPAPDSVPSP